MGSHQPDIDQTRPATMLLFLLLALAPQSRGLTVVSEACARCQQPEFPPGSGRALYLPHCVSGTSYNYCEAVCTGQQVNAVNRGSCEGCEAKCGMVFKPVCTKDQKLVYPNICQAKCAGVEDTVDCQGIESIIPGKTKLPPSHLLPDHLQNLVPSELNQDSDI